MVSCLEYELLIFLVCGRFGGRHIDRGRQGEQGNFTQEERGSCYSLLGAKCSRYDGREHMRLLQEIFTLWSEGIQ